MSSNNKYKIHITQPALDDIEAIAAYTYLNWGLDQQQKYTNALKQSIKTLSADPDIGTSRFGVPNVIKGQKSGSHVIFYRLDGQTIYVLRILHQSMDHGRYL